MRREEGQAATEYALLLVAALAIILFLINLGSSLGDAFTTGIGALS